MMIVVKILGTTPCKSYRGREFVETSGGDEDDEVCLIADATPEGWMRCLDYVHRYPKVKFTRLNIPYNDYYHTPKEAFGNIFYKCPNVQKKDEWVFLTHTMITGRIKWKKSFDPYEVVPFSSEEAEENIRYIDAFKYRQIATGRTICQQYAIEVFRLGQDTIHELACRCVSRYDIQLQVAIDQISALWPKTIGPMEVLTQKPSPIATHLPYFLASFHAEKIEIKRYIQKRLARQPIVDLPQLLCSEVFVDGGLIVPPNLYLETWLDRKLDLICVEKGNRLESRSNRNSVGYKERLFIEMFYMRNRDGYDILAVENEDEQQAMLLRKFNHDESLVNHLQSLSVRAINNKIYKEMTMEEKQASPQTILNTQIEQANDGILAY